MAAVQNSQIFKQAIVDDAADRDGFAASGWQPIDVMCRRDPKVDQGEFPG